MVWAGDNIGPRIIVVSGVSGSGKSTIGKLLASHLEYPFFDADDYHPPANVEKMRAGTPLSDEDRWPWLHCLSQLLENEARQEAGCVLACSALKRSYREVLSSGPTLCLHPRLFILVLLDPPLEELERRTRERSQSGQHFMPPSLLPSQLATLEADPSALHFSSGTAAEIVASILQRLRRQPPD